LKIFQHSAPTSPISRAIHDGTGGAGQSRMAKINSFRDLLVWQKAMNLAERCYRMSRRLPRDEQWVLGQQLRKSCVSIPSNIAEGFGRHHTAQYVLHLHIANGSNNELQTQVEVGQRVDVVSEREATAIIADAEEVGRMLKGLVRSLERPGPHVLHG
jgi:four helix bundle protein